MCTLTLTAKNPNCESAMWNAAWTKFFGEKSHVFYDIIVSHDPAKSLEFVPTRAQIEKLAPRNPNGYSTGMEDGMILGGIMMCAVLDKYEITHDKSLKEYATKILDGMANCTLSPQAYGFVARAVGNDGTKAFFPATSRDQYTHCVYGIWKYYNSPLADEADKALMRKIARAIADRMIEKITPATNFDAQNADGTPSTFGHSKMWNVEPHEAARLPMIYAVAWNTTRDEKYLTEYKKYANAAVKQSADFHKKWLAPWAQLQMQESLEVMAAFAETKEQKREIESIMKSCADIARKRLKEAAEKIKTTDLYKMPYNPLTRPIMANGKPDMGGKNGELDDTFRVPRYFGEMALTLLTRGGKDLDKESAELIKSVLNTIDYDRLPTCSLIFHLAVYYSSAEAFLGL